MALRRIQDEGGTGSAERRTWLGIVVLLWPCVCDLMLEARYLDPDPLLLTSSEGEPASNNPRFHALNQAIVQLVRAHSAQVPAQRRKLILPPDGMYFDHDLCMGGNRGSRDVLTPSNDTDDSNVGR